MRARNCTSQTNTPVRVAFCAWRGICSASSCEALTACSSNPAQASAVITPRDCLMNSRKAKANAKCKMHTEMSAMRVLVRKQMNRRVTTQRLGERVAPSPLGASHDFCNSEWQPTHETDARSLQYRLRTALQNEEERIEQSAYLTAQ